MLKKSLIEKLQLAAIIISLIGGTLKYFKLPSANFLLIIGLSSVALCHFLMGLASEELSAKERMINYARNFSIAVLALGILFYLMHWQGAKNMLIAGIGSAVASFGFQFLMPEKENKD